jgi:hypothetical protein
MITWAPHGDNVLIVLWRQFLLRSLLVVFGLFLPALCHFDHSQAHADQVWIPAMPTARELTDMFLQIAPFGAMSASVPGVARWKKSIRLYIVGDVTPHQMRHIVRAIETIEDLAKVNFIFYDKSGEIVQSRTKLINNNLLGDNYRVEEIKSLDWHRELILDIHTLEAIEITFSSGSDTKKIVADMVLVFGSRSSIKKLSDRGNYISGSEMNRRQFFEQAVSGGTFCFGLLNFDLWFNPYALQSAAIFIPDDLPEWLIRRCINEEITQAMGVWNDIFEDTRTLFNDVVSPLYTELTTWDRLFLKILYHPDIGPGEVSSTLRDKVERLIEAELKKMWVPDLVPYTANGRER